MHRKGQPKCRQTHEFSSRVNQAWTQTKAYVFDNEQYNVQTLPLEHFKCRCNAIVYVDKNGFAACDKCGLVFNDKMSYAPRKGEHGHSHLNRFIDGCKA